MPHSISPGDSPTSSQEDIVLPDAPAQPSSDGKQDSDSDESDGAVARAEETTKSTAKTEIKLQDLFKDDDDSDEEFPGSAATDSKMESSPPATPV